MDGDLFGTLYSTNIHLSVSLYRFAIQLHCLFFGLAVNRPTMPESRPRLWYGHRLCACEGHGSSLDPHRRLWPVVGVSPQVVAPVVPVVPVVLVPVVLVPVVCRLQAGNTNTQSVVVHPLEVAHHISKSAGCSIWTSPRPSRFARANHLVPRIAQEGIR